MPKVNLQTMISHRPLVESVDDHRVFPHLLEVGQIGPVGLQGGRGGGRLEREGEGVVGHMTVM